MPTLDVKLVNLSNNEPPAYESAGAAGMDIRAHLTEKIILRPMERLLVSTGLYMQIPAGFEAQVRPRSGLAFKHGITCLNTPGTIDSDYRGEVKVMLINLGQEAFAINPGDRIAQMVVQSVTQVQWQAVIALDETDRGAGGFGHTGR